MKKQRGYKLNLLKCSVCGVETEYGIGWAFLGQSGNRKCEGPDKSDQNFLLRHDWQKIGARFVSTEGK